jgi:hypothetical protein
MNRLLWARLQRWYCSASLLQRWSAKIFVACLVIFCVLIVTHGPTDRPRRPKIVLNCDHCGTDPERTISYNEYMDRKEQQQQTWFREAKQQAQQNIWDERGRQRWCREHPRDRNCK